MKRKLKQKVAEFDITYELHNKTAQQVFDLMEWYRENYTEKENWRLIVESGYDHTEILIVADVWETDKEMEVREKRNKKAKESAKKRRLKKELEERQLLEKLRKKYEV